MSDDSRPTKVASHDMQLAVLVNMGFDPVKAEQALEVNEWNVDQSIDYLICRGVVSDTSVVPDEDDAAKIQERRLRQNSSSTLSSNRVDAYRGRRSDADADELEDTVDESLFLDEFDGIDSVSMSPLPHGSSRPPSRRTVPPTSTRQSHQIKTRGDTGESAQIVRSNLEDPHRIQQSKPRVRPPYEYENDKFGFPAVEEDVAWVAPNHSFEDRLDRGFVIPGLPTMSPDVGAREQAAKYPGAQAVYGVGYGLPCTKESMALPSSRRQVSDDGTSSVNAVAECLGVDTTSADSPIAAAQLVSTPTEVDRNRRHIQRLYILVCMAIVLVLAGVGVAVGLVFVLGDKNQAPGDTATTTPVSNTNTSAQPQVSPGPTLAPVVSPTTTAPPASSPLQVTTDPPSSTTATTDVPVPTTSDALRVPLKETAEPTPSPTPLFTRRLEPEQGAMTRFLRRGRHEQ